MVYLVPKPVKGLVPRPDLLRAITVRLTTGNSDGSVNISYYLAYSYVLGGPREQVAAFTAAPRLHKSAVPQFTKDDLKEPGRNPLCLRNIAGFDRAGVVSQRQLEKGLESILAFL